MSAQNTDYQHVQTKNICPCVNLEKQRGQTICGHECTARVFRGTETPARMNEGGSLDLIVCLPNQCVFLQSLES